MFAKRSNFGKSCNFTIYHIGIESAFQMKTYGNCIQAENKSINKKKNSVHIYVLYVTLISNGFVMKLKG